MKTQEVIVISGPSGSGKFSALKILEDQGFSVIDNLPGELFPNLLTLYQSARQKKSLALVMDARNPEFLLHFDRYKQLAKKRGFYLRLFYLETQDSILLRRFSETRRRHPLSPYGHIQKGIRNERQLLQVFKKKADHLIDTSHLTVHDLREVILQHIKRRGTRHALPINIITFGYRHGIPLDADLMMDVRFLPNPFFQTHLKKLSGRHKLVRDFLLKHSETKSFLSLFRKLLKTTLAYYQKEGKTYLTLAFGCTAGHHRSVAMGEIMAKHLKSWGFAVNIRHRDLDKGI